jgi:trehalose 6-phosphate phosphatase
MKGRLSYLFRNTAFSKMSNFIDKTTLFAFDLDGTLAPIASNPSVIGIPDSIRQEFAILNKQAVVAVITGRSRLDALHHLGISPRYLIGNHGAEGIPGWENRESEFIQIANQWQSQLDRLLPRNDRGGIMIENKGATISIHYRQSDNIRNTHAMILGAINRLIPQPRRIGGKYVENMIPEGAPDKGIAFSILMEKSGCRKGFFAGDDETDEDVFRMDNTNLFTVRVGRKTSSRASYYLEDQNEIRRLLCEINGILYGNAHQVRSLK